ncbi:MAG: VWA domain-containing protein [gamma proteobacterium symbiont of Bathyaustriella thionipta]|nr:VWA domain-containing protein [gamma proteobacterium symbiont of Bathyaustriella thionipta]MCU7951593.1 VWA domain-containing protein [gamma proteobacterium symbiont of Bathyaustriella thionipta]MCU7967750.1 VWA domain-containing protein [gamma proteobacterium symbiont of Bathyaustriella thionipta]
MEEHVGQIWDKLVTRISDKSYKESAVSLSDVSKPLGIFFRALGGDNALRIVESTATQHFAKRNWKHRVAGTGKYVELSWQDEDTLHLPKQICTFPDTDLNKDLYYWLAAINAHTLENPSAKARGLQGWFTYSQNLTLEVLARFPGLQSRYDRLVAAYLQLRNIDEKFNEQEQAQENAIAQALVQPGSIEKLPVSQHAPKPVILWPHPNPPEVADLSSQRSLADEENDDEQSESSKPKKNDKENKRRNAERVDMPDGKDGLILHRFESIFGFSEFLNVNRSTEDDDEADQDSADKNADDMDFLSVARDNKTKGGKVKFDLDLPAESMDEIVLESDVLLPEWDYKKQILQKDYCSVINMVHTTGEHGELPENLRRTAKKLRHQLEALTTKRVWHRHQSEGSEMDMDAYINYVGERFSGHKVEQPDLYQQLRSSERDLSCLLLADFSLSTDTWLSNDARIIDVIRDSLFLFSESLRNTGDQFSIYGFSSRNRGHIRFNTLKTFQESYNGMVRSRIQAIKPGFYTRLGAAIRYASAKLEVQDTQQRLLLILTDGKPNDLDRYEGRYGVEDTRRAIHEARVKGLQTFCITIDDQGGEYLPHIFGNNGFTIIRKPEHLPQKLPILYANLTTNPT